MNSVKIQRNEILISKLITLGASPVLLRADFGVVTDGTHFRSRSGNQLWKIVVIAAIFHNVQTLKDRKKTKENLTEAWKPLPFDYRTIANATTNI